MALKKLGIPLILLGFGTTGAAQAEGDPLVFADVFGGYSWSQDQDADLATMIGGQPSSLKFNDLDVHNGPTFGGRLGFWLKSRPNLGLAIDATVFDTDIDRQVANVSQAGPGFTGNFTTATSDIRVSNVLVTFDFIYRRPGEQFTPYVFGGPGFMFTSLDKGGTFAFDNDDDDVTFGYKVGAGLSYKISEMMHLFVEYRYIASEPEYEQNATDNTVIPPATVNADVQIDINSHLAVGGLSFRF